MDDLPQWLHISSHHWDVARLRLVGIYEICGTAYAFAALKHDGTVLTWGHPVAWHQPWTE